MTEWFAGMLLIASVAMCVGLWPLVRLEIISANVKWNHNKALRIAGALLVHAVGALVLLSAAFLGKVGDMIAPLWFTWTAFSLWLIAKSMIVSVTGWFRTMLIAYAIWSGFCVFAVSNHWWS